MTINLPNAQLKGVLVAHFILTSWGLLGHWSPRSYEYYNLLFMATLMWSIHHRDSEEPLFMAIVINTLCIILDIVTLAICFPQGDMISGNYFSAIMAICNLLGRPVSIIILVRLFRERDGNLSGFGIGGNFGDILGVGSSNRSPYEDIDHMGPNDTLPRSSTDSLGSPTHYNFAAETPTVHKTPPPSYHN